MVLSDLRSLLHSASEPTKPEQRYKVLTSADLAALPPLAWRVRGVVYGSPLDAML